MCCLEENRNGVKMNHSGRIIGLQPRSKSSLSLPSTCAPPTITEHLVRPSASGQKNTYSSHPANCVFHHNLKFTLKLELICSAGLCRPLTFFFFRKGLFDIFLEKNNTTYEAALYQLVFRVNKIGVVLNIWRIQWVEETKIGRQTKRNLQQIQEIE